MRATSVTIASLDGNDTLSITREPSGAVSFDPDNPGASFNLTAARMALEFLEELERLAAEPPA